MDWQTWTNKEVSSLILGIGVMDLMNLRGQFTHCWTDVNVCVRTVANSLMRCGLLAVDSNWTIEASTISSLMPSRSTLGIKSASDISTLVAGVGEGGGVCSMMASAGAEATPCDRLRRLLGCESMRSAIESERCADVAGDDDDDEEEEEEDGRLGAFDEAAAARAAWVTGICIPRLGRDSDLRRVLYGILKLFARRGIIRQEEGKPTGKGDCCYMNTPRDEADGRASRLYQSVFRIRGGRRGQRRSDVLFLRRHKTQNGFPGARRNGMEERKDKMAFYNIGTRTKGGDSNRSARTGDWGGPSQVW